jgi:hypothetical protein
MIDRLTAVCLVGSAFLAGILLPEFRSGVAEPTALSEPSAKSAGPTTTLMNEPAIKQLVATTLARPLFSATRRPPESEQGAHPDTLLNDLRLTGILVTPDQQVAIFAKAGEKPLVRSEGEMISDRKIDNIAAQSVSLSGPSGTTTLEPRPDPNLVRVQPSAAKPAMPLPAPAAKPATPSPAPAAANQPLVPAANAPIRPEMPPQRK